MANLYSQNTLSGVCDLLMPAVHHASSLSPNIRANVEVNYVEDAIDLYVKHRLLSRREIDGGTYRYVVGDRIKAAMLIKEPMAKDLRVERRRLRARGETAQKHKPKKIVRKAKA